MPCKTKKTKVKKTPRQARGPKKKKTTKKKKKKTKVPKTKISKKLLKKLDEAKIKYEVVSHRVVFTAFDLAQTLGADVKEITKALVVKADRDYIIVLLPANAQLDTQKIKKKTGAKKIKIASEKDMVKKLKVKPGAAHPFGSIFKLPVYIDNKVAKLKTAYFQPGSFTDSIKMKVKDFIKLEEPTKGAFSKAKKLPKVKKHKPKKTRKKKSGSGKKRRLGSARRPAKKKK